MEIVLYEPEIPPNTGNVVRLCAATGTRLHLVEPLGFRLDHSKLRRAGLDYWPNVDLEVWPDWKAWLDAASRARGGRAPRCIMSSARGGAPLHRFSFIPDDCLVLGPETRGLPPELLRQGERVRIPMRPGGVRSINMSTAAGILLYAALASSGLLDAAGWC